jgi:hypothetical protein
MACPIAFKLLQTVPIGSSKVVGPCWGLHTVNYCMLAYAYAVLGPCRQQILYAVP